MPIMGFWGITNAIWLSILVQCAFSQLESTLSQGVINSIDSKCAAQLEGPEGLRDVFYAMQHSGKAVSCGKLGLVHQAESYVDVLYGHIVCQQAKCDCGVAIGSASQEVLAGGLGAVGDNLANMKALLNAVKKGVTSDEDGKIVEAASAMYSRTDDGVVSDPEMYALLTSLDAKPTIKPKYMALSFQAFIGGAASTDLGIATSSLESVRLLENAKYFPMHVKLETTSFKAGSRVVLTPQVFSALGAPVVADVQVTGVKNGGGEAVSYAAGGADLAPGRYSAEISVSPSDRSKPVTTATSFVVAGGASVTALKTLVSRNEAVDAGSMENGAFSGELADASAGHVLHVSFQVDSVLATKPSQTLVRIVHKASGHAVHTAAKAMGDGSFRTVIPLAKEAKTFRHASGEYEVAVFVGDAAMETPQQVSAGSVTLNFPEPTKVIEPLYAKSLLDESDRTLSPLPDITHVMREPPRRANPALSLIFSALPTMAAVIFIGFALRLATMSKSKKGFMPTGMIELGFMVCMIAAVALTTGFWLGLAPFAFYDTIKYVCVLTPVTAIFAMKLAYA